MTVTAELFGILLVDYIRVLAVLLTVIVMWGVSVPILNAPGRPTARTFVLMLCIWTYMGRAAVAAIANLGEPYMPWYATPVTLMAAAIGCVYLAMWRRDVKRGQRLAQRLEGVTPTSPPRTSPR